MFDGKVFFSLSAIRDQALCACCLCEAAVWDCRTQGPAKRCWEEMKLIVAPGFSCFLATMTLSVWEEIARGRTMSSCDFGGEPVQCARAPQGLPELLCLLHLIPFLAGISAVSHCGAKLRSWLNPCSLNQHLSCVRAGGSAWTPLSGVCMGICLVLSPFSA